MKLKLILASAILTLSSTMVSAQNWAGFYAGGFATSSEHTMSNSLTVFSDGAIGGGVFGGYNYYVSPNIVLGGEVYYDATRYTTFPFFSTDLEGQYGIRGRVGWDMGNTLLYGALGADFGMFDVVGSPPGFASTLSGYSAAIGLEHMIATNLSVRAEYSYTQYNEYLPFFSGYTPSVRAIRLGVAYHF